MYTRLTKKELKTVLIILGVVIIGSLVIFLRPVVKKYQESRVTPEQKASLDEWTRVSKATKKLVPEDLWNSSVNEATLVAATLEAGTEFSLYTQYQLNNDRAYETVVVAGTFESFKNETERQIVREKLSNAYATTEATRVLKDYDPVVSGTILNWVSYGEIYALIDVNGDGSWDYVSKGKEAHFSEDGGNLVYVDDVGKTTYVVAGNTKEVISPHFTLQEAVKYYNS